jgi:hypothetical protein
LLTQPPQCNCAGVRSGHRLLLRLLFKLFYGSSGCARFFIFLFPLSSFFVGLIPRGEWSATFYQRRELDWVDKETSLDEQMGGRY